MAVCLHCSVQNPEDARFCMSCGQPLGSGCGNCGTHLPPGARFCPSCGAKTAAVPVESRETIKLVTILFADVVGSTAQAEHMSPDEVRALMADFFETMIEEVEAEGGTVERLIGDAIMADFGVPVAREDDPVRAVRAARRMLDRLEVFNALRAEPMRIQIRVGINTGEVSTGGSMGERLMVMGDSVNVAARLEQSAEPGTVVVGERTARLVRDFFELKELDPIDAKGKTAPVGAFAVERERDEPLTARSSTPLIGRAHELEHLVRVFETAQRERRPHVVTIIGEPGAGKTRLVMEFLTAATADIVVGRCAPLEGGLTLWPFRDILRERAGLSSDDSPDTALEKLRVLSRALPQELAGGADRTAAALGSTIGLESALRELSRLDPREIQREMFAAWAALLTGLADGRPLVVVVDDIHWADAMTLEMLRHVAGTVEGPVLFVCAARPEFVGSHSDWIGHIRNYTAINLDPLPEAESTRLAFKLLEEAGTERTLADKIVQKAGGNPLFIHELSLCLLDEGAANNDDSSRQREEIEVPDSIQAVIQARLDLLPPEERLVAQKAAVVGRFFWESALSRITQVKEISPALRDLAQRQLVNQRIPSSLAGEAEYGFAHILIRDVAYESLPRRVRGQTHAEVARWLEERRGERATELAEILSQHCQSAYELLEDESSRHCAREYCLLAARNALRRFATHTAETYARRAVELSHPGTEKIQALEAVGDLYSLTHHSDGAYVAYREALDELDPTDPEVNEDVARLAGKAAVVPTRWWGTMDRLPSEEELQQLIRRGVEATSADSDSQVMLYSAKAFASNLAYELGEGAESAERAVHIAQELDEPDLLSLALDAQAASLFPQGCWARIHELNLKRIEIIPDLQDVREICDAYGMAAVTSLRKGLYRDAHRFATSELERARAIDPGSYMQGLVWHLVSSFMVGDWDAVIADQQELSSLQSDDELPGPMAIRGYTAAMFCSELRGDPAGANEIGHVFETYLAAGLTTGGHGLPEAVRFYAGRGRFDDARSLLSTERNDFLSLHLEAWCEVARLQETWDEVPHLLNVARSEADEQGLPNLSAFADRVEGARAAAMGDALAAIHLFRRSAEGFAALEAAWEEAMSRVLLAEATEGDMPASVGDAESAFETFSRLASVQEINRAREALERLRRPIP